MSPEIYRDRLIAPPGPVRHGPAPAAAALPPRLWFRPERPDDTVSLRHLYDAGVRCADADARARLESRIEAFEPELDRAHANVARAFDSLTTARADLDEARRTFEGHERELKAALDAARERIGVIESSTAWRMTFPLRAGVHRLKLLARGLRSPPPLAKTPTLHANDVLPMLERDRGAARRVLVVEMCMLTPDQDSGSLRTWRLLTIMREMGCKVTFVAANLEHREPYTTRMQQEGIEVLFAPLVRSIDELIRERGAEFDIIVLARHSLASRHIDAVRRHATRALLVFDTIDLHFVRSRRRAQLEGSAALAQSAEAIYREEVECFRRCDVTWVVSEVERAIVSREVPRATVLVQTNVHWPVDRVRSFAEREGLLFVGGFRHPPNVDAVLYLAREIVPLLRRRLPGVVTYVVGSNPPDAIRDLRAEGVEVVGFAPELEPWLERCRISVSPLRYGAGVKGKVSQAMSHGLPVVASPVSIEGMHLVEGEEVLVADDPEEFADAIARLYHDEASWNRLSLAGVANVQRHFSPEVARRSLAALFTIAARRATS